ncbi:HDOD domain-containing protein [Rhodocyclus tenuis]|uniref:Putative nucleotidyltransferase with HDIG domain n=1 Tax=Rhodocyclus tenuis TaxID=1066 RepID=A0A840GA19_RHOTE|nr:HDOD domain-containing protein [Rhodocyclus tenuis]MBB4247750.1 putative nucleotidyltransferase with HDIG domain [Rhodocyclus tenuis]
MSHKLLREEVVASRDLLPVFPRVISEIFATLDDPESNLGVLEKLVARDPVLVARVLHLANVAASRSRRDDSIFNLYTAIALIGLAQLREEVIKSKLTGFVHGLLPAGVLPGLWQHGAATGVCAEQLALHLGLPAVPALVAGLLHDIGQVWLCRFQPAAFLSAWEEAKTRSTTIEAAERERFGVDHATIGAWLADSWGLPMQVCVAIRYHHCPDTALSVPLVPLLHVANVLSNALDLGGDYARVSALSQQCCDALGLRWDDSADLLFARIEAANRASAHFYDSPPAA